MARYTSSFCKLCQRAQNKLILKGSRCLTAKCALERQKKTAGRRRRRVSDRGLQLIEKQKARYIYGILERQFRQIFDRALRQPGVTGENLKVLLERRLDNVVYRLGYAESRPQARQLVSHGHIMVNGHKTDIPSSLIKEGDTISWRATSTKNEYYKQLLETIQSKSLVSWLSLDRENLVGQVVSLPTPDEAETNYDEKAIVEYYSR
ncbi:MAG: 30S ribosomal protein S4 [Chloroflexi bacterium]|nr:30S ribosomal protein S4 [Chloroflexota bacterium]